MNEKKDSSSETDSTAKGISVAKMRSGQHGKIVEIIGGCNLEKRLEALGIRKGREIKKISEQWMKGPVLLQHGHSQIALGFQMASKVFVEITTRN